MAVPALWAQSDALVLSSGTAATNGYASLSLNLTSSGSAPASLQFTLSFLPTQVLAISAGVGSAATSARKSIVCASGSGSLTCLLSGLNATAIANGTVATVNVTLGQGVAMTSIGVNGFAASPSGTQISLSGSGGVVLGSQANVGSLGCTPTSLSAGNTATCTVTLTQAAAAGGTTVSVASSNGLLAVPSSVTVPAGATTTTFSATAASSIASNQSANVTASIGTSTGTATISLLATASIISNLSCSPATLSASGVSSCRLTLTQAATGGGLVFTLASNNPLLTVPSTVTVGAGATSGTFNATASASISSDQSVTVGASLGVSATTTTVELVGLPGGLQFVPVTPCRVTDTRLATGPFGGPSMEAGSTRDFNIPSGACGIPGNAAAYSLNVTAVPVSSVLNFLAIWPSGQAKPWVSTLNSDDGRIKANAAIVPAGTNGGVAVYVSDASNVVLDINGYFVANNSAALQFFPVTPCRLADTRSANGPLGGPYLKGGAMRSFPLLSSSCNIPSTAQAYSLNLTAVPYSQLWFLAAWPTGKTQPVVSTLNADTGVVTANAAIVPAGTGGAINLYATDDSDLVIDVNGYFAPIGAGGLSFYTVSPCRVLDTRTGSGMFSGTMDVAVSPSACVSAPTAQAFVLNATVIPPQSLSYVTFWPMGQTKPYVSTLNAQDSQITSNMAVVTGNAGWVAAFTTDQTQLVLDLSGYFAP